MGEHVRYTDELGESIAALIEDGQSIRAIGKMDGMPNQTTIRRWYGDEKHPFCARHARARESRTWMHIETMEAMAAAVLNGSKTPGQVQTAFNIYSWMAERLNPGVFSRRVVLDQNIKSDTGIMAITPPINDLEEWKKKKGIKVYGSDPAEGAADGLTS